MIESLDFRFEDLRLKGSPLSDFPEGSILEAALLDTKRRIADAFEGQTKVHVTLCVRVSSDTSLEVEPEKEA